MSQTPKVKVGRCQTAVLNPINTAPKFGLCIYQGFINPDSVDVHVGVECQTVQLRVLQHILDMDVRLGLSIESISYL